MNREQLVMKVLYYFNEGKTDINIESLELSKVQFSMLIEGMKKDGLIDNISIQYYDDKPHIIDISNARITINGSEHLKSINQAIENDILQVLYDNKYDSSLSDGQIKKELFIHLKHKEIVSYLNILKGKGLLTVEKKKSQAYKNLNIPAQTYEMFRISQKGIEYIENGFNVILSNKFTSIVADKIVEIADNTAQTNNLLSSISRTFDITLNAMGLQHQKTMQQNITTNKLLEQYLELLESKDAGKENKIITFLSKLSGDIVIGLIAEASKKIII